MTNQQSNFLEKLVKKIEESEDILLVTHIYPDLDSTCSCLALRDYLKKNFPFKNVYIENSHERNEIIYPEIAEIKEKGFQQKNFDLCIILDCCDMKSITKRCREVIKDSKSVFVIDHHDIEEEIDKRFECLVDPEFSSCCELIVDTFGVSKFTKYGLEKILDGIYSDSLELKMAKNSTFKKIWKIGVAGVDMRGTIIRVGNLLYNRLEEIRDNLLGEKAIVRKGKIEINLNEKERINFTINHMLTKLSYVKQVEGSWVKHPIEASLCSIHKKEEIDIILIVSEFMEKEKVEEFVKSNGFREYRCRNRFKFHKTGVSEKEWRSIRGNFWNYF